jgi:hypothetical protein
MKAKAISAAKMAIGENINENEMKKIEEMAAKIMAKNRAKRHISWRKP